MEITSKNPKYKSSQTGVIGLGPYTANAPKEKDLNFMKTIVDRKIIQHNVVSFNITFP